MFSSLVALSVLCACSQQSATLGPRSVANAEVLKDIQSDRPSPKADNPKAPPELNELVFVDWVVPDEVVVVRIDYQAMYATGAHSTRWRDHRWRDPLEVLTKGMRVALAEHRLIADPIVLKTVTPDDTRSTASVRGLILRVEPKNQQKE